MGQAALARRAKHSKRSYVGDICGFGLRRAFPAEILNFLRRGAYQALLIRTSRAALRAFPQAEASLLRIDFRKIHGRPIKETSDFGHHVHLIPVSVLVQDEVSTRGAVMDDTIGLRTGVRERLCRVTIAVQEAPIQPHFRMMFVTKCVKFIARLGSRHNPSSRTPPNRLSSETVSRRNALVPLDFGVVPQYLLSYASGVQVSSVYSPESTCQKNCLIPRRSFS